MSRFRPPMNRSDPRMGCPPLSWNSGERASRVLRGRLLREAVVQRGEQFGDARLRLVAHVREAERRGRSGLRAPAATEGEQRREAEAEQRPGRGFRDARDTETYKDE